MNLHFTKQLKHGMNFEYAENIRSSNVVKCECKLSDILKHNVTSY